MADARASRWAAQSPPSWPPSPNKIGDEGGTPLAVSDGNRSCWASCI